MDQVRKLPSRLGRLVGVVLGVCVLTFFLINLLPGNVATAVLGDQATPEQVAALTAQLGLDQPIPLRFLFWLGAAVQGDLGSSLVNHQPVWDAVVPRIPVTLELVGLALLFAIGAAVPAALIAVRKPGGVVDRLLGLLSFSFLATPSFLIGLIVILIFAINLHWFPVSGWIPFTEDPLGNLSTAFLPALTLAATPFAYFSRLLRADMAEQLTREDYVTTARAKGVPRRGILYGHVLRNSVFPMMTMVGLTTSLLVGGSVVVESIFGVPGIGSLLIQSITSRDVPVVLGIVVFIAASVVIVNLVIDMLYGVVDPRIRHDHADA
ncbi:ABC transporter permease [Microbacterium sp. B2969]|uniref:ABC transporter permease n=1 Tax=Microbacterium alkaliflavum TaxID=3248839 RepID=A0ABW7Q6Y5_9MICO